MVPEAQDPRRRLSGRPRDLGVDQRIHQAALDEYATVGWSALTMDAVARRAKVGKQALYLRYQDKASLLLAAVDLRLPRVADIDTGSLRGDLVALASQLMEGYLTGPGFVALRLMIESRFMAELRERAQRQNTSQVLAGRAIVRRAIVRGEIKPETSVTVLLDALCGGVMNHILSTPAPLRSDVEEATDRFIAGLVDVLLAGTYASSGEDPEP